MKKELSNDINFLEGVQKYFGDSKVKPEQYSALGLAYIGDGVFDLIIRTIVLDMGNGKVKNFHRITSSIVKAESQAKITKAILDELTEEENAIYKHGRNAKSSTSAKNASIVDYRIATGFEALIGYLYLNNRLERALELIKMGLERTELMPHK
ncbi:MAG: ribonuclease III [Lachnospiraceae bacterium]|nr:ribonuclease III [Lachnospiraceae bacterium]MCI5586626.1 ribonuclease III [Lachnospiraceae bacterium]